jgi:hypothetical protein
MIKLFKLILWSLGAARPRESCEGRTQDAQGLDGLKV